MTQKQIIDAYKVLNKLNSQPMPIKTAYALHKLRRVLQPAWDFQVERENALLQKYKPELVENGVLQFKSPDDLREWNETMAEVNALPSDIDVTPVTVAMTDYMRLAPSDIDQLEGFVIFEEG